MASSVQATGDDADYLKRVSLSLRKQLSKPVVKVSSNPIFDAGGGGDIFQVCHQSPHESTGTSQVKNQLIYHAVCCIHVLMETRPEMSTVPCTLLIKCHQPSPRPPTTNARHPWILVAQARPPPPHKVFHRTQPSRSLRAARDLRYRSPPLVSPITSQTNS